MIKFENTEVMNFNGAFRGMRNPLNSWDKSDSYYGCGDIKCHECEYIANCNRDYYHKSYHIGENDLALAQKLIKAGSDHRKFLRQIFVSVDITAPSFWWYEYDTYKVATVRNSCSKMHRIHVKEFERSDFSLEGADEIINTDSWFNAEMVKTHIFNTLELLERLRVEFNETKDKKYWRALIELLPSSYNMRATVTLNYETLRNIYGSRRNHKLDEWSVGFMEWIDSLPYAEELIKYNG